MAWWPVPGPIQHFSSQVTVSTALLRLLETMQDEFVQAASVELSTKPTAPYVIENHVSIPIQIKPSSDFENDQGSPFNDLFFPRLFDAIFRCSLILFILYISLRLYRNDGS